MNRFSIIREGRIVDASGEPLVGDDLEGLLDGVQEHLLTLTGIDDPDLGAMLATGDVRVCVDVEAADPAEAVRLGDGAIRTALHAAHIATPAWEAPAVTDDAVAVLEGGTLTVQPA
ncbi:MAG: hypothetical protein WD004_02035 [Actinomycetota bacterium]